jgi:putative heme-binding domain-containing protein
LEEYQKSVSLIGDRAQGKVHFQKHCSACHQLEGIGHNVGPDLLALTDKSFQSLLVAMLDPNRAVEDKFLEYVATTEDGQLYSGMITSETGVSLTLTSSDGKEHNILRRDLDEFRSSGKSLMPEGLERDLSPQQVADVMAYVRGFARPHKTFPNNEPATVIAGADGSIRLPATRARIYGPSLVFEQQFQNLGYWHSTEDLAIWQLEVPVANSYRVSFDYACHASVAGQRFKLSVAGKSLSGIVKSTGTWGNYQTLAVGTLDLPNGPVELIMRSEGAINQAMIDLNSIQLTPIQD